MFIQSLIAVAVTVGIAVVWTMAITVASVIWQRQEVREFLTSHQVASRSQADDAREVVLH
jgi:hypothetical protein